MFNNFSKETGGNVAMMFGVSVMAILMAVGAAIDFSSAASQRGHYQNLADQAVLAAALSGETETKDLTAVAQDNLNAHNFKKEAIGLSLEKEKQTIKVELSGYYKPKMLGLFGVKSVKVEVVSAAPISAEHPINIALVLDVTGSMSGAKMTSLKTAANGLISALDAKDSETIKVGVVPFAQYVNVGTDKRDEAWMDVPLDTSKKEPEHCYMTKDTISSSNCKKVEKTCTDDGVSYDCSYDECDYEYGPEYEYCYIPETTTSWNGCAGSRTDPWHKRARFGNNAIPGIMNVSCGVPLLEMTDNLSTVKTKIQELTTQGETYMPSGLMWGWRLLNKKEPFKLKSKDGTKNIMILMTDGENTKSKDADTHNGSDVADANDLTSKLCTAAKNDGIELYTIAYEVQSKLTLKLLKKCASGPDNFYSADNAKKLSEAFDNIASNLNKMRLTH